MGNMFMLIVLVEKWLKNGFKAAIFLFNLSFYSFKNFWELTLTGNLLKFVFVELCTVVKVLADYSWETVNDARRYLDNVGIFYSQKKICFLECLLDMNGHFWYSFFKRHTLIYLKWVKGNLFYFLIRCLA